MVPVAKVGFANGPMEQSGSLRLSSKSIDIRPDPCVHGVTVRIVTRYTIRLDTPDAGGSLSSSATVRYGLSHFTFVVWLAFS